MTTFTGFGGTLTDGTGRQYPVAEWKVTQELQKFEEAMAQLGVNLQGVYDALNRASIRLSSWRWWHHNQPRRYPEISKRIRRYRERALRRYRRATG